MFSFYFFSCCVWLCGHLSFPQSLLTGKNSFSAWWMRRLNGLIITSDMTLLTFGFLILAETFPLIPVFALTRLSGPIGHLVSICKKKFTKTWCKTSHNIRESGIGFSSKPDANIDHRRVPNLRVFFQRKGETLPVSNRREDYSPGDLVTYDLGGNVPHIGIVVDRKGTSGRYMIEHNIGRGPQIEDVLFDWKITGHYRYYGP